MAGQILKEILQDLGSVGHESGLVTLKRDSDYDSG